MLGTGQTQTKGEASSVLLNDAGVDTVHKGVPNRLFVMGAAMEASTRVTLMLVCPSCSSPVSTVAGRP